MAGAPTAFQPNAFQNNAFQIGLFGHDGGYVLLTESDLHKVHGIKKKYDEVVELLPEKKEEPVLARAIQNYREEPKEALPLSSKINFEALYFNEVARNKLERVLNDKLSRIKKLHQEQDEEDLLLTFLMAASLP